MKILKLVARERQYTAFELLLLAVATGHAVRDELVLSINFLVILMVSILLIKKENAV